MVGEHRLDPGRFDSLCGFGLMGPSSFTIMVLGSENCTFLLALFFVGNSFFCFFFARSGFWGSLLDGVTVI